MLADQLDYVVGVDPHRDSHALAVFDVRNRVVVFEANVAANSGGYRQALVLGEEHAAGRRVFAVEGTGSFGAGLTRFLTGRGERVVEVGRLRRERCSGRARSGGPVGPAISARNWSPMSMKAAPADRPRRESSKNCP
jgi:transposase